MVESKLKHLNKAMNETIFENISFNQEHQQKVLQTIKKQPQKKGFRIGDRFNRVLSIAVTSCLFIGIAYFVGAKIHLLNGGQERMTEGTQQEAKVNPTVYTPPKQEESFKEMTKEEILTKMLNTIHNFETAKGQFKVNYDRTSAGDVLVDYDISLNHNVGLYERERNLVNNDDQSLAYNDSSIYMIDNRYRIYKGGNKGGQKPGQKPLLNGIMNRSLFPDQIAADLKKDKNIWEIEKQNEMVVGHNTIVLKGKFFSGESNSFRYWVDKDTGILLKEEVYNPSGKVVDYLEPAKLEVNVPIDSKDFMPNLKGYKYTDDMELERMKRDSQPHMVTGNIDRLIPEELTKKWVQAKKSPDKTSIFHLNGYWYIFVEEGYFPELIDKDGVLHLTKSSPQKSKGNYGAWAKGYKFDELKVVYDKN